jgi:hypothetical protein
MALPLFLFYGTPGWCRALESLDRDALGVRRLLDGGYRCFNPSPK